MSKAFEKKFGFVRPPSSFFSGTWEAFKTCIEAKLKCHLCGAEVNIRFKGNPDSMKPGAIDTWILQRAAKLHQCLAIEDMLIAGKRKYYADLYRGREKEFESNRKLMGGFGGKFTGNA